MRCPSCGHDSERVGFSQTFECPACGAVHLASDNRQTPATGRAGSPSGLSAADAERLAQIQARAVEERLAKTAQPATSTPGALGAAGRRGSSWVPWAMTLVITAAGAGLFAALGGFGNSSTTADDAAGLERLAEAGEPGAQLAVALIHDYGFRGTAGDTEQARHWYQRAANGGSASAQYYLGKWYLTHAPEADRPESVHWLKRAAEQGQAEAQYLLGELHRTGNGVAKDVTQAADWYRQAADQGNGQAMCRLARLYAGVEAGYTLDPPVAAMHDQVARTLGEDCGLPVSDYGASDKLADWAKQEGTRLAQTRLAKGFTRRPGP